MMYSANRIGLGKAMAAEQKYTQNSSTKFNINVYLIINLLVPSLYIGKTQNQRSLTSNADTQTTARPGHCPWTTGTPTNQSCETHRSLTNQSPRTLARTGHGPWTNGTQKDHQRFEREICFKLFFTYVFIKIYCTLCQVNTNPYLCSSRKLTPIRAVPGTRLRKHITPSGQLNGIKLRSWPLHSGHGFKKVYIKKIVVRYHHAILNLLVNMSTWDQYPGREMNKSKGTKVLKVTNRKEVRTYKYTIKICNNEGLGTTYPGRHREADPDTQSPTRKVSARAPTRRKDKIYTVTYGYCASSNQDSITYMLVSHIKPYTSKLTLVNSFEYSPQSMPNKTKQACPNRIHTHMSSLNIEDRTKDTGYRHSENIYAYSIKAIYLTLYRSNMYQVNTFEYFLAAYTVVLESNKTYTSKQAAINTFEYFFKQEQKSYKQKPAYKQTYTRVAPLPGTDRPAVTSCGCQENPHTCTILPTTSTLYRQKSHQTSTFEYFYLCTRKNVTHVKSFLTTVKTGMTAVKTKMTAVKLGLTHSSKIRLQISRDRHVGSSSNKVQSNAPPSKYKFHKGHKVQMSCRRHVTPKYKFHKVQKVQISCSRHVNSRREKNSNY